MGKKITIDIDDLRGESGYFSERDIQTLTKATGKEFWELTGQAVPSAEAEFTAEEVAAMSDAEYEAKREKILEAMQNGTIGNGTPKKAKAFKSEQINAMSDTEYEKNRADIMKAMKQGQVD